MRRFIINSFFLLSLCTLLNNTKISGSEVDRGLHQTCLYPTIYVGRADKESYGSGVIVRSEKVNNLYRNVFLTCAHLVDNSYKNYEVKQYLYENWSQVRCIKVYPATFVAYNHEMDIAIGVFISDEQMPIAKLDFDPKLYIGSEVFRIGCGLGEEPRLDYGKMTALRKIPKIFRTSVMTVPGDSGSPLFHENKVIAIVVSIRSYHNLPVFNISFAVPLERFKQWDKINNNALSFAWDTTKNLPEFQFHALKLREYEEK